MRHIQIAHAHVHCLQLSLMELLTCSDYRGASSGTGLNCYIKDGSIDGSKTYVSCGAGSSSGYKVTVYYPNSTTVVETYDNQAQHIGSIDCD